MAVSTGGVYANAAAGGKLLGTPCVLDIARRVATVLQRQNLYGMANPGAATKIQPIWKEWLVKQEFDTGEVGGADA